MRGALVSIFVTALLGTSAAHADGQNAPTGVWYITKSEWTEADEKGFGDFVRAIGHSGCTATVECLRVAANPYRDSDPKSLKFIADCADFPYMLRAYYAWKNGLPFSYVNGVSGKGSDIRFEGGNHPSSRRPRVGTLWTTGRDFPRSKSCRRFTSASGRRRTAQIPDR